MSVIGTMPPDIADRWVKRIEHRRVDGSAMVWEWRQGDAGYRLVSPAPLNTPRYNPWRGTERIGVER